jgi:ribonuclease Z
MNTDNQDTNTNTQPAANVSRRDALKSLGAVAAGLAAAAATPSALAQDAKTDPCEPKNPYGGGPGTGISLPPYYKPTDSVKNNNVYYPGMEELGDDEMRISFIGSCPFPPRINQAGTAIMVECGPDKRFFFDFGSGCIRNIIALQLPIGLVNDIFITHLHVDHYADIPYLLPFSASCGLRFKPLRVTGPSGRTPDLGTQSMIINMKKMLKWHLEEFDTCPVGDGFEVEVNEFDWKKENDICYDKDGVTVRHWPRSHGKDGASAYRLDWNGLSFVWTGDGRPDELTAKYAKGCDVFVTECQNDIGKLMSMKMGMPEELYNYVIDTHHTPHYAAGYLMKQINPRIGMVTHLELEPGLHNELCAGIRTHWDGLFVVGAPDVKVVNVTKDAIWTREASLIGLANPKKPDPSDALALAWDTSRGPGQFFLPKVKIPREEQQEEFLRKMEIDPAKYYPPDVNRPMVTEMPTVNEILWEKIKSKFGGK